MCIQFFFLFQIENCEIQENIIESEEGNEGWVETHHYDLSISPLNEKISMLTIEVNIIFYTYDYNFSYD